MKITVTPGGKPNITIAQETAVVQTPTGKKTIAVGIGKERDFNRRKLILLARTIITLAKKNKLADIALRISDLTKQTVPQYAQDEADLAELLAVNFEMANFEFTKYKSGKNNNASVKSVKIIGKLASQVKRALNKGQIIGKEINACRELANTPGGEMTPRHLAEAALAATENLPIKINVLTKEEMQALNMGAILGVAQGSAEEPKFIILEYRGNENMKPIVFIGKGITFDTGGLNLKPTDAILEMHMDMSGAAAVLHAVIAAAKLKLTCHVIGLIPAAENMPSGSAYRPGDILKSMSGKTIEITNTDAEGRVVLADGLTYAKRYKPQLVVDVATLTGAAMVALGKRASAVFTRDEKLEQLIRKLSEQSGDYVWPLPLWDEFEEEIKGTFGDIANAQKSKYGGAITGAMFLYQFAKDYPWIHLDIAPRMTSIEGEHLAKGAAGAPVRLLVKLLEQYQITPN